MRALSPALRPNSHAQKKSHLKHGWLINSSLPLQVVCGELGESVLEQLSALSQDVVLPLLSNPANHVGISDGVGREVQDRLHQFIADGMLQPLHVLQEAANPVMALLTWPEIASAVGLQMLIGTGAIFSSRDIVIPKRTCSLSF